MSQYMQSTAAMIDPFDGLRRESYLWWNGAMIAKGNSMTLENGGQLLSESPAMSAVCLAISTSLPSQSCQT